MIALLACISPWVIDGDSLRCRGDKARAGEFVGEVRMLGIDAPDRRSSRPCRLHFGDHVCDDRGARVAKGTLIRAKQKLGPIRVQVVTRDRYGRAVAMVWAGPPPVGKGGAARKNSAAKAINLSCWQLERGSARYVAAYDDGKMLARACAAARPNAGL